MATCAPFGERAGEIGEFPEGHASMPVGARFPGSGIVLPGRLGSQREDRDVGCVGGLSFGVAADETDKGDSIEVHTFLLVLPVRLGHPKASGRGSQDKKLLFWGDRNGGARTDGCERKAEASQMPGAAIAPKQCREERAGQGERDRMDHHSAGRSRAVGMP